MQAEKLTLHDLRKHLREPCLLELESRNRLSEHHSVARVGNRFLVTGQCRAERTPGNSISRLRQAHQRTLDSARLGEKRGRRDFDVLENQLAGVRRAQRELPFLIPGCETRRVCWNYESTDRFVALIVTGLGPYNRDLCGGSVGDPHLGAVDDPAAVLLFP